jgi:hypothetical protein
MNNTGVRLAPGLEHLHSSFHVTMFFPVRIEVWGLVGDFDVFGDLGNDRVIPHFADEIGSFAVVHVLVLLSCE